MKKRPLPPHTKLHSEHAEKVFSGKRFDVYQWQQKQFDGSVATFETIKRNDSVIVIPVIDDEIVLVKEQQPHWDEPGTALAAGMVNADEDLESAARRELEEETGMIFENYHLVHVDIYILGIEWFGYTFIASGYKSQKEKSLDPGEKNEVVRMSVDTVIEMTRAGRFLHRPRFIEHMLIANKETELKDLLKNPRAYWDSK